MKIVLIAILLFLPLGVSAEETGQVDGLVPINTENVREIQQVDMHGYGVVEDIAWSPNGETVVVAGSLGLVFYGAVLFERAPSQRWQLPEAMVYAVAYHPNGSILATVSGDPFLYRNREVVYRLWDVNTGLLYSEWTQTTQISPHIMFSPDGTELAFTRGLEDVPHWNVSNPQNVTALEPETWTEIQRRWYAPNSVEIDIPFYRLILSPTGNTATYYTTDGEIAVIDPQSGEHQFSIEPNDLHGSNQLLISPDGQLLVSTARTEAGGGIIQVWDITTGDLLFEAHPGGVRAIGLHPHQSAIMFKTDYGTDVHYWQRGMQSSETVLGQTILWQPNQFTDLDFHPDGSILAAVHGGAVELWDVNRGVKIRDDLYIESTNETDNAILLTDAAFSPNGTLLAVASRNMNGQVTEAYLYLWDVQTWEIRGRIRYDYHLLSLAFNPDSTLLATYHRTRDAPAPNVVYLWDIEAAIETDTTTQMMATIWTVNLGSDYSGDVRFSPDGAMLGITGLGVELWDVARVLEQGEVGSFDDFDDSARLASFDGLGPLAFSPNGYLIAYVSNQDDYHLVVRHIQTEAIVNCLGTDIPTGNYPQAVEFIDNTLLVSGAEVPLNNSATISTGLHVWNVETGVLVSTLEGHFEEYNDIAVHPDNRMIVSAGGGHITCYECPSFDGSLRIWGIPSDR